MASEREGKIRAYLDERGFDEFEGLDALLVELAAVTRERDEARLSVETWLAEERAILERQVAAARAEGRREGVLDLFKLMQAWREDDSDDREFYQALDDSVSELLPSEVPR